MFLHWYLYVWVAGAMHDIHAAGFLYRDMKPQVLLMFVYMYVYTL